MNKEFDKILERLDKLENLFIKRNSRTCAAGVHQSKKIVQEVAEEMMDSRVCEKPKTNADRIRSMSDEELAELFVYWDCDGADYTTNLPINGCKWGSKEEMLSRVLEYLQSEVEE